MALKGIDVSSHQGNINWEKLKGVIDFAMIRAGYGKNNIDSYAHTNIQNCLKHDIPFGLYWFSYALNEQMAINEANYVCDIADTSFPTYPIAYDYEYDSDDYAKRSGVTINPVDRKKFAVAFLETVKKRGYKPMLYTNIDYLNKGFMDLKFNYDLWLAQWGVSKPSVDCKIWQYSDEKKYSGITGEVDANISYYDYSENNKQIYTPETIASATVDKINKYISETYLPLATDIIKGKYGNGETRKKKLKELGYDYNIAQDIVNYLLRK